MSAGKEEIETDGVDVWVARDKVDKIDKEIYYDLFVYTREPTIRRKCFSSVGSDVMAMRNNVFPSIKPGECRKARIVLVEEGK